VSPTCVNQLHDECADKEPRECTCGPLRDHILPPWAIYPVIKVQNYLQAHLKKMYSTNSTCHTNAEHNVSQCCFLLLVQTFIILLHFDGQIVELFRFLSSKGSRNYHSFHSSFTPSFFCFSPKERPNNVKNGSSGSTDDSELNITPDGQVLQVVFFCLFVVGFFAHIAE